MANTPDLAAVSAIIEAAELAALTELQTALATLTASLDTVIAGLNYTPGFRSDALRIANDLKAQAANQWRTDEINNLVAAMTAPAPSSTPSE